MVQRERNCFCPWTTLIAHYFVPRGHNFSHKGLFKAKKLAFVAGRMLPPPVSNKRPAKVTLMGFNLRV